MRKSYKFSKKTIDIPTFRYNNMIKAPVVKVVNERGEFLGDIPTSQALRQAQESGFDLVEVNPSANPPVAKFLNYGSFKYQQEKQAKQQKKQLKKIETKGIRLSTKIGDHDIETRRKKTEEFLEDGQKVRIEIILRGRENQHQDLAREVIAAFTAKITTPFEVEQPTNRLGNKIFTIILPTKKS